MQLMKDGIGSKRLLALVAALFGMVMIVIRVVTKQLSTEELVVWLAFITADAGVLTAGTVAEKRREQAGGNPTQGQVG